MALVHERIQVLRLQLVCNAKQRILKLALLVRTLELVEFLAGIIRLAIIEDRDQPARHCLCNTRQDSSFSLTSAPVRYPC